MNTTDQHGAAKNGVIGEATLTSFFDENDLTLYKLKRDIEDIGYAYEGTIKFQQPSHWPKKQNGEAPEFLSDGFCPELELIVEMKFGDKHGTVEEKVFYDLKKIESGVYGLDYPLAYIFGGASAETDHRYKHFEIELEMLQRAGNPYAQNTKVFWFSQMTAQDLADFAGGNKCPVEFDGAVL